VYNGEGTDGQPFLPGLGCDATHPAAGLSRPSKGEDEPEIEPTEDDLHAALESEERDEPEE
jgi:hypothetical protein